MTADFDAAEMWVAKYFGDGLQPNTLPMFSPDPLPPARTQACAAERPRPVVPPTMTTVRSPSSECCMGENVSKRPLAKSAISSFQGNFADFATPACCVSLGSPRRNQLYVLLSSGT